MDRDYIVDPIIKVVCIGDKAIEYFSATCYNNSIVLSVNSDVKVDSEDIKELLQDTDLVIVLITESMIDIQIGMKILKIARKVSEFVFMIFAVPFHLQLSKNTSSVNNYLHMFQCIDVPIFQVDTNSNETTVFKGINDTVQAVYSFIMPRHEEDVPIGAIDIFNFQCYCEYKLISAFKYSKIDAIYLSLAESLQILYDCLPECIEASYSVETTLSIPIDEIGTAIFASYVQMTNNNE